MNKKTALYEEHLKLKAKMVDFAGWQMPIQYSGIINEHTAVRNSSGVFDVSHMCVLDCSGNSAYDFLQFVTVNDINKLQLNQSQYSMVLNNDGQILDDIIVSKMNGFYRLVINSSNESKIKQWFEFVVEEKSFNVELNYRDDLSIIALQGPQSQRILEDMLGISISLKSFALMEGKWEDINLIISRTGYTGELGFEIFIDNNQASSFWQEILARGATPSGLGARDTLRIEAGLPLYGKEIIDDITPYDMGYGWVVSLSAKDFIGKNILKLKAKDRHYLYGCVLEEKGVLRDGYEVINHGLITSGTYSPTLNTSIAMFYSKSELQENTFISVKIRGKELKARVLFLPFLKKKINK